MLRTCFVAVIATALPACTSTDDTADPADDSAVDRPPTPLTGSTGTPPAAAPARVVAAVDDPSGGRVEIYAPAGPNEIAVGVGAQYPSPPPVTGEFILTHDPIEVFLAVASVGTPVPVALRQAYPLLTVRDDAFTRARLHAELAVQLAAFPTFDEPRERAGSCSAAFIAWFNGVYHDMPGREEGTCSAQGSEAFHAEDAQYKKDTPGYIPIICDGLDDPDPTKCDGCALQATSCDEWDLTFRDWQFGFVDLHAPNFGQQVDRHDMHTGLATCAGTVTFHRQWAGQVWDIDLAAGHGFQTYVGTFPYAAGPAAGLSGGVWDVAPPPRFARTEAMNVSSLESYIWCGNLEDQWSIDDTGCNNWCDSDPSDGTGCNERDYCLEGPPPP